MENPDDQKDYWNSVSEEKTFTHPLDIAMLQRHASCSSVVLDYGCGYGRLTHELVEAGYWQAIGVDTSESLIKRGQLLHPGLALKVITNLATITVDFLSADAILLFAVLTCIPSNAGQQMLINRLFDLLKPGGIIYISDYYLQENSTELERYTYLNNDPGNYGVFTLQEGATFRHHTKEWIRHLLAAFEFVEEKEVAVLTMNQHSAAAFQIIARKPALIQQHQR